MADVPHTNPAAAPPNAPQWERDLTEEGIEPHPGPRYLCKNVNGMSGVKTYEKIFANIKRAHAKAPIAAVFIQEHNIPQTEADKAMATALDWGLHLFIAPRPSTTMRGGTAIIMPRDMIQTIGDETVPQALARVRDSEQSLPSGRGIAIDTRVGDHDLRLVSA